MTKLSLLLVLAVASCGGAATPAPATPAETTPPPASSVEAPPAPSAGSDILAQAALAEQYDLGQRLYVEKKCASCHGDHGEGNPKNPAVIGASAFPEAAPSAAKLRKGVTFATAADVLAFVRTKMPIKEPGTLTDDEAAAITSWMLSESSKAISAPLDATNAASVSLR